MSAPDLPPLKLSYFDRCPRGQEDWLTGLLHAYATAAVEADRAQLKEGVMKADRCYRWDTLAQHHIPTLVVEFEPVPGNTPNDAKGWADRDRLANFLKESNHE